MNNQKAIAIPEHLLQRKGAQKAADIPAEAVELLNRGRLETVNLTEWLAVDHRILLHHVINELGLLQEQDTAFAEAGLANESKIMKIIPAIAQGWLELAERKPDAERARIFGALAAHRSDSVRCWAAYIVGLDQRLSLSQKLKGIRPFAADSHFGVREIAWMAVREPITNELEESLAILYEWARDQDANVRRFAVEAIRPQGVWAKHISALKQNPGMALPILEHVKSDPVKYVQDSVGNWLNDAGKTAPDWVNQVCDAWLELSDTKETRRIVTKGKRSLLKK
ncbi:DNA alkylation repair protein [Paenibacillus contaminans]|uniref:DNA alkylation repair protein n=1 Tax=Paenibacillus contaminans TaxID=450362 RepID=A0A329M0M4_9BACL|nr:DNA alkylation repair protein [Paenibacillus contaminans]RAV13288.1 DNA alkylation repair protein [Paenibacillus contaminans]